MMNICVRKLKENHDDDGKKRKKNYWGEREESRADLRHKLFLLEMK